jgi:hypothetical protein
MGVVFFAFAALYLAQKDGAVAVAATLILGIVAVGVQATGLFAMPLVAVLWALRGRRARAVVAAACAAALWALYFTDYVRPGSHPSIFAALSRPLETVYLFFVIVGGIFPGRAYGVAAAVALLLALGWALRRGLWKVSPTAVAWLAFIFLSVAATTVGRVGFGVHHASRYAILSSCLAMIALLALAALARPMTAREAFRVAAAGALVSVVITLASWFHASEYSFRARLLAKVVASDPDVRAAPYFGALYPDLVRANRILADAGKRGLWTAREQVVLPTTVTTAASFAQDAPAAGVLDRVVQEGTRLRITGWSHIPATLPGRTLTLGGAGSPIRLAMTLQERLDVAERTRVASLLFSGFTLEVDYASTDEAARAAASLCVLGDGASRDPRRLSASPGCPIR